MVFDEARGPEARALMTGRTLSAPSLIAYELANVAWKKAQRGEAHLDQLLEALEVASVLEIDLLEVPSAAALLLAAELQITAYDASYVYCSRLLGAPLLTFDERLSAVPS